MYYIPDSHLIMGNWYTPTEYDIQHDSGSLKLKKTACTKKFTDPLVYEDVDFPGCQDAYYPENIDVRPMQIQQYKKFDQMRYDNLTVATPDPVANHTNEHILMNPRYYARNTFNDEVNDETKNPYSAQYGGNKFEFALQLNGQNTEDKKLRLEREDEQQEFTTIYGDVLEAVRMCEVQGVRIPE